MGSRLESNADAVRKRIASHTFDDEDGEEYDASKFGGFSDYFRRKKVKLQNLDADIRAQHAGRPAIFKGVVAHVNGYTQPSLNDLHQLIVQHGGGFMQYLDGKTTVTHILASSLTPKKAVEFKRYRIVKPAWVVDSVRAGKLLPWNRYRVVDEGDKQRVLSFGNGKVISEANVKARGYRDQTDTSWYTSQLRQARERLPTPKEGSEELPPPHWSATGLRDESVLNIEADISVSRQSSTPPRMSPTVDPRPHPPTVIARDNDVEDTQDELNDGPSTPAQPARDDETPATTGRKTALSAEEHNAILLRDPKIRKSTVVDPNFLEQYYRESRLHHLSTWKADLKAQLQALASEKSASQKVKHKRPPGTRRYILHVDFDSFFVAISLKKNAQYKDKPAVVAHGNGSGSEIASCNYPARKFGIKNGMWMKKAQALCPELKVLPYDFPGYEEASRAFYDALLSTDGIVQSVSVDEALIDVSALCIAASGGDGKKTTEGSIYREQAEADAIAQSLREEVKKRTDCNVSVGIGGNVLLAKVALRKAKPAGQYQIKPEEVLDFIGQLQVQDLPGVAWSIGGKLEEIRVKFVKDIRELSKNKLMQTLGPKTGEKLWEYSRGIDRTEVGEQVARKSVSAEVNWGVRFENQEQADEFVGSLCRELQKRLLKENVKGKQFSMKVMRRSADAPLDPPKHLGHGQCDTYNKSLVLGVSTNSHEVLTKEALSMLRGLGFSPGELRGIGVQMTKLEPMKSASDGNVESSQRRLQFRVRNSEPSSARKAPKIAHADPIQDDPETPKKQKLAETKHIAFGAEQLNRSTPSRRPLNTLGTQFVLPTQVDPNILDELPDDIRSKLLRQARQSSPTPSARKSRDSLPSAAAAFTSTTPPTSSTDYANTLTSLPPKVHGDFVPQYAPAAELSSPLRSSHGRRTDQAVLPQSPRKDRIIGLPAKKPHVQPVKRGRGRPPKSAQLASAAAATAKHQSGKTLMQARFISLKQPTLIDKDSSVEPTSLYDNSVEGLDEEVLTALPEDVRREVIEEHKRAKLQASHLAISPEQVSAPAVEPSITLPTKVPRPLKPSFPMQQSSDLRKAMKLWVADFADEGPYSEDAEAFVKYLRAVVLEERDIGKATGLVNWMGWVVDDTHRNNDGDRWKAAIEKFKKGVREAASERGLGVVCFD